MPCTLSHGSVHAVTLIQFSTTESIVYCVIMLQSLAEVLMPCDIQPNSLIIGVLLLTAFIILNSNVPLHLMITVMNTWKAILPDVHFISVLSYLFAASWGEFLLVWISEGYETWHDTQIIFSICVRDKLTFILLFGWKHLFTRTLLSSWVVCWSQTCRNTDQDKYSSVQLNKHKCMWAREHCGSRKWVICANFMPQFLIRLPFCSAFWVTPPILQSFPQPASGFWVLTIILKVQ